MRKERENIFFSSIKELELIPDATESLVFIGTTLSFLQYDVFQILLASKIKAGVSMTFLMLDPQIKEQDPVYRVWQEQSYEGWAEGDLTASLQKTLGVLERLNTLGKSRGNPIKAFGMKDFPPYSLTIVDFLSQKQKILLGIYIHDNPPVFLSIKRAPQTQQIQDALSRFYIGLLPGRPLLT